MSMLLFFWGVLVTVVVWSAYSFASTAFLVAHTFELDCLAVVGFLFMLAGLILVTGGGYA